MNIISTIRNYFRRNVERKQFLREYPDLRFCHVTPRGTVVYINTYLGYYGGYINDYLDRKCPMDGGVMVVHMDCVEDSANRSHGELTFRRPEQALGPQWQAILERRTHLAGDINSDL